MMVRRVKARNQTSQPRQALCRPAKTDVTDKQNRAKQKVRLPR